MNPLHAICVLRGGHLPGGPVIFSYARMDRSVSQWPNRRGPTRIVIKGSECPRCGAFYKKAGPEGFEPARELVENLTAKEPS